jgi:hypothetical protein
MPSPQLTPIKEKTMNTLLKLAGMVLLKSHRITDARSCQVFLRELVLLTKSLAIETKTPIDDALLKPIEFIVNNNVLFDYAYRLILDQLQAPDILFESADEDAISEIVENSTESPETIDPVLIVSLITQIISFINRNKNK